VRNQLGQEPAPRPKHSAQPVENLPIGQRLEPPECVDIVHTLCIARVFWSPDLPRCGAMRDARRNNDAFVVNASPAAAEAAPHGSTPATTGALRRRAQKSVNERVTSFSILNGTRRATTSLLYEATRASAGGVGVRAAFGFKMNEPAPGVDGEVVRGRWVLRCATPLVSRSHPRWRGWARSLEVCGSLTCWTAWSIWGEASSRALRPS